MRRGVSVDEIVAQLQAQGVKVSRATVARRMRELSGQVAEARATTMRKVKASRAKAPADSEPGPDAADDAPLPETPEDIPAVASLEQLDRWIRYADAAVEAAQLDDDRTALGPLLRVASALAETRRKATPPTPPDPNLNPDMIEAAERVRKRWHALAESLVRVSRSTLAESIGRLIHGEPDAEGKTEESS